MYVKCPHCGTSFALDPAVVKDFGGWARCGACMQPFNSETAALDELPVDDPNDVLVRKFDYADDAGSTKEQSHDASKRNSFVLEPHSRSEIPEFLRVGEAESASESAGDDQAQIPLPLNDDQLEPQSSAEQSVETEQSNLGEGFESPLGESEEELAVEASLSILVSSPEEISSSAQSTASAADTGEGDQESADKETADELDWRQQLEADIAAAEQDADGGSDVEDHLGTIDVNAASVEAVTEDLVYEPEVDEELQMSSNIEPSVAAWPDVEVASGTEQVDDSSEGEEESESPRVEKQKDYGFGSVSSHSGAYGKVMAENEGLQKPRIWMAAVATLSILAAVQLVSLNKLELSQTVFGRPLVNLWCGLSGCRAGELVQVGKIDLVHTAVSAHDTEAGVLVVDVHMVSRTQLGQPHPAIQLTLTDRDGMPAARRVFTAGEYLANDAKNELAPNVITELKLEIADPPDDSVGFEVALVDQRF